MAEYKRDGVRLFEEATRSYRDRYGGGASYGGLTSGISRFEAIKGLRGLDSDQRARILQTQPRPSATEGRSVGSKSHRTSSQPKS